VNVEIWVLAIEHKYGINVTVHSSKAKAEEELRRYVLEWWEQEMEPDDVLPDLIMDYDIQFYFEKANEEYWIEPSRLDDGVQLELGTSRG